MKRILGYKFVGLCSCLSLSVLLLSACTPRIKSDVVTFHTDDLPRGETIRVQPMDVDQEDSQEFEHYARMVRDKLRVLGYTPVGSDQPAALVAEMDYSISEGQTKIRSNNPSYVRYHFHYGNFRDPFYYGFYNDWPPDIYSYTVYNRMLTLNIVRTEPTREVLFEGRVQSIGTENEIAEVMPYLITAMFTNFPGESGVTKVVSIEKNR